MAPALSRYRLNASFLVSDILTRVSICKGTSLGELDFKLLSRERDARQYNPLSLSQQRIMPSESARTAVVTDLKATVLVFRYSVFAVRPRSWDRSDSLKGCKAVRMH